MQLKLFKRSYRLNFETWHAFHIGAPNFAFHLSFRILHYSGKEKEEKNCVPYGVGFHFGYLLCRLEWRFSDFHPTFICTKSSEKMCSMCSTRSTSRCSRNFFVYQIGFFLHTRRIVQFVYRILKKLF